MIKEQLERRVEELERRVKELETRQLERRFHYPVHMPPPYQTQISDPPPPDAMGTITLSGGVYEWQPH